MSNDLEFQIKVKADIEAGKAAELQFEKLKEASKSASPEMEKLGDQVEHTYKKMEHAIPTVDSFGAKIVKHFIGAGTLAHVALGLLAGTIGTLAGLLIGELAHALDVSREKFDEMFSAVRPNIQALSNAAKS